MLKKLFVCTIFLLITVEEVNAEECYAKETDFAPYSSASYGLAENVSEDKTTPSHVYNHLLRLQQKLQSIGFKPVTHSQALLIKSAMPRTNLILVYDLFQLTQSWHQKQTGVVRPRATLKIPLEIKPMHVYQWVDSTYAYLNCNYPNEQGTLPITKGEQKTPLDVFYLIEEVLSQLLLALGDKEIERIIAKRVNKSHYAVQDIALSKGNQRVADWGLFSSEEKLVQPLESLLIQSLYQVQQMTNVNYISHSISLGTMSKSDKLRLNYLTTSLILTELNHYTSNKKQNINSLTRLENFAMVETDKLGLIMTDMLKLLENWKEN